MAAAAAVDWLPRSVWPTYVQFHSVSRPPVQLLGDLFIEQIEARSLGDVSGASRLPSGWHRLPLLISPVPSASLGGGAQDPWLPWLHREVARGASTVEVKLTGTADYGWLHSPRHKGTATDSSGAAGVHFALLLVRETPVSDALQSVRWYYDDDDADVDCPSSPGAAVTVRAARQPKKGPRAREARRARLRAFIDVSQPTLLENRREARDPRVGRWHRPAYVVPEGGAVSQLCPANSRSAPGGLLERGLADACQASLTAAFQRAECAWWPGGSPCSVADCGDACRAWVSSAGIKVALRHVSLLSAQNALLGPYPGRGLLTVALASLLVAGSRVPEAHGGSASDLTCLGVCRRLRVSGRQVLRRARCIASESEYWSYVREGLS